MIKLFDVNEREDLSHCDTMLSDFSDAVFQRAFRQYFSELGIHIRDWDGIFSEMNEDNNNFAGKTTERHSCGWQRIISWKTKFIPAS